MIEIWKDIEGFGNLYQISNMGRVRSLDRWVNFGNKKRLIKGKIKTPKINNSGYMIVSLFKENKEKTFLMHRLVAQAFIPNHNNLPEVNHKDENKTNNMVWVNEDGSINYDKSNLEWCNRQYNCAYGNRNEIMGKKHRKPILQMTIDGCLVKKWDSAQDVANELFYDKGNIGRCCLGKQLTYKNHIWKYYDLDTYLIGKMNRNIKEKRMAS